MTKDRMRAGARIAQVVGAGLALGALALAAPTGVAVADPDTGPGADPVINDYLDRVNALVDQFTGEDASHSLGADQFNSLLNAENARLIDAVIAAKLPR